MQIGIDRMIKGGFPVGPDGRVHTTFGHNPSSLRLCSFDPNLQNIPRGTTDEIERWVKECFVAPAGHCFWERDFSAIEAVLVGYFAGSGRYIRFAKLGVHDYLSSHLIGEPVDLSLSDSAIRDVFKHNKKEHPAERDIAKRVVHLSNYMGTPKKMAYEYPETFKSTKEAARLQGLYFELFPEIRTWHRELCLRVDGTKRRSGKGIDTGVDPWTLGVCYARNPFGYIHHFYNVLDWEKYGSEWIWSFGEDAKRLVSFLPQSTAAAIIKKAAKAIYREGAVGDTLRLLIHDSILGECPDVLVERCLSESARVMEAPIEELPLDPAWGMGPYLTVGTEAKVGKSWGAMS